MRVTTIVGVLVLAFSIEQSASSVGTYPWHLPRGLPVPRVPADNPISQLKIDLGRRLFYDTRLSGKGNYACATCHQQSFAFTDGLAHAVGSTGAEHARSTMTLTNVAYNADLRLGGSRPSHARSTNARADVQRAPDRTGHQGPRGGDRRAVLVGPGDGGRVRLGVPGPAGPGVAPNIVKAIASFERTLVSADSPFDRYLYRDDKSAMSAAALRGKDRFFSEALGCSECHASFNLSGPITFERATPVEPLFHNTGLYNVNGRGAYPPSDRGLIDRTHKASDMGRFRAPTLRNIAVTAPYMHDGSIETLEAAIDHYASGGVRSPVKSKRLKGFALTPEQRKDLAAFLESLTDKSFLTNPAFGPMR